jgi:hypothetical protein
MWLRRKSGKSTMEISNNQLAQRPQAPSINQPLPSLGHPSKAIMREARRGIDMRIKFWLPLTYAFMCSFNSTPVGCRVYQALGRALEIPLKDSQLWWVGGPERELLITRYDTKEAIFSSMYEHGGTRLDGEEESAKFRQGLQEVRHWAIVSVK